MASKLTAEQQRRVDEILQFQRTVEHVAKLVAELEGNRAAKSSFIDNLCETIARELSQMRQRALTANIGTLGDVAGAMSVMAGRGGGIFMKIRGLNDGLTSLRMQLDETLTVEETVRLFRSFYRRSHTVDEVLGLVELGEKRGAWVGKLSGGQKQRLAVACALVSRPELLFLDEPTTGLDPQSRRQLWDVIGRFRAAGGTVLLTTHYMEEAERLCDRVAIMDHGKVIALGTPRSLIASLGAEHVVEFALADGATRAPSPSELAALPGVRAVRPALRRTALTVAEVHRAVPALLGLLERRGAELSLLATHHATLETSSCRSPAGSCAMRDHPLVQLTLARMREFYREPEAIFWVFGFPLVLAFALGVAFRNRGPGELKVGVLRAPGDSAVAAALDRAPALAATVLDSSDARIALRTGRVALLVGPGAPLVSRDDSTRTESRLARLEADAALQRARGRADAASVRDERITEPGARYIDFLIPGLLGMNLMGSGLWGVGFSVVQARTKKLLKRLMATPMRRGHYLLSFILSRLLFLFLEIAALVGFGWVMFGVGVRGSYGALALITVLGALSFAGLGLLVASRARTIEAVSGLMNLVMLPMWILSGTFFSYARFPDAMQPLVKALPLTALNDALRAVMIDGSRLGDLGAPLGIVTAWGFVSFVVALQIFRWR